jgi:hypothetical protein
MFERVCFCVIGEDFVEVAVQKLKERMADE